MSKNKQKYFITLELVVTRERLCDDFGLDTTKPLTQQKIEKALRQAEADVNNTADESGLYVEHIRCQKA